MKYILLTLSFCASACFFWLSLGVRFDNSVWLDDDNVHKQNKDYLYTEFDRGENLVVAIELGTDFFQPYWVDMFTRITEEIEEADGVVEIKTPLTATSIIQHKGIMQILGFQKALEKGIIADLDEYKERFRKSQYHGRLLSKDFQKISLLIKIEAPLEEDNYLRRQSIIQKVRAVLAKYLAKQETHIAYTGEVRLNHALAKYTQENLFLLLPAVILLIFLLLYFVFRSLFKVCLTIYIALMVLLLSFAYFALQDYPLTAIGIALPVLILVIAIADAIHVFNRWHERSAESHDLEQAARQSLKETWLPCLMTSITTALGFGSFYFSELVPLRQFGESSAFVIIMAYVLIMLHLWLFLYIFPEKLREQRASRQSSLQAHHAYLERFLALLTRFTLRRYSAIVLVLAGLSAAGIYSLQFVRTETNFLDVFFKKRSKIYQDFDYVDRHLGGTGAVDIIVQSSKDEAFKDIKTLDSLRENESILKQYPKVQYIQSYLTPIRMIHKEFVSDGSLLPDNNQELAQEILFLEFSRGEKNNDVLSPYVDFDYKSSRIHLQTPNLNSSAAKQIRDYVQEGFQLLKDQSYKLTGSSIFFQTLGEYVIDTQLFSLGLTLCFIWALFMIQFGFKLATLGLITNCLPILLTGAAIIYLDIAFDFATVVIASVSFGLCVDDTIHFLHFYHLQKKRSRFFQEQISRVVASIGRAIYFTSVLFSLGFVVFVASDLVVLLKFGAFTLLSLILAFFANVLVLPALLCCFDGRQAGSRSMQVQNVND